MLKLVHDGTVADDVPVVDLDELCRRAAQQMLATALLVERQAYLDAHADELDACGRRLVVGNGYLPEREIVTGAGPVSVKAPRVDDRREGEAFSSSILPAYMRRSPKVTEVLPVLYLRGLSTGDFAPALASFLGSDAGLSPSTISRLCEAWQAEHTEWVSRDLSCVDYVYWWVDGIHFNVRLETDRLCCLVIVGVRPDGSKELVALVDGYREDTDSWADLLRDLKARGLRGPNLAVGDGALGFWAALRDVFPTTGEQRCWVHKTANVLAALPKRLHADAKTAIAAIYTAETRAEAIGAARAFGDAFASHPKATKKILDELDTCGARKCARGCCQARCLHPGAPCFASSTGSSPPLRVSLRVRGGPRTSRSSCYATSSWPCGDRSIGPNSTMTTGACSARSLLRSPADSATAGSSHQRRCCVGTADASPGIGPNHSLAGRVGRRPRSSYVV